METIIQLDDIRYSYHGKIPALAAVDLAVKEGEMLAVLGSNGSGKSTLLQIMSGLLFPDAGRVRFHGKEVSEKSLRDPAFMRFFRERVGFVFQSSDVQLFCPTVLDELLFGPLQIGLDREVAMERSRQVLSMLGVDHLRDRPSYMLSGGEKKRVAIGCVLTMNPEVLLFDEPMSGLDPKTQAFLIEVITMLAESGKTVIMATHDLGLVSDLQPRVAVLSEDHRIEKTGRAQDILGDEDLLVRVNLIHEHIHRHGKKLHTHPHTHFFLHKH